MRTLMLWFLSGAAVVQAQNPQRIRVTVEREASGAWHPVDAATVFAPGDHVRFRVSSSFAGFLYVMNQGTSGNYELLFPRSDTGSDNHIEASKDYIVPASQGWFKVTGPAGQDVVYWLIGPVDLGRQYRPLPPPPAPGEAPPALTPRCDGSIFRSRGDCIDSSAGIKPVKPGEKLPQNMEGVVTATPRELLFIQDQGQTVLSSPAPLTGPIVYEIRLAHR